MKKGKYLAKGIRLIQEIPSPDQHLPMLKKVILPESILIESYKISMPYQPREAEVAIYGKHKHGNTYEATNIDDITPLDTSAGRIHSGFPPLRYYDWYAKGKRLVAVFHSHPSGCDFVSDTDRKTEKRYKLHRDDCGNILLASLTPEGIFTFFGHSHYKIINTDKLKKISKNKYQLDISDLETIVR